MIVKQDIVHEGQTLVYGSDFNTNEYIDFFYNTLNMCSKGIQGEFKRLINDNKIIIDSIFGDEENIMSIDTNIGPALVINIFNIVVSNDVSATGVEKTMTAYLHVGLREEKLDMLVKEGRISYKSETKVIIDGIEYDSEDKHFNSYFAGIEKELNTYVFERMIKSSIFVCMVPYETALNEFLELTCTSPGNSSAIH